MEILNTETRQRYDVVIKDHNVNSKTNSINATIGTVWNNLPFDIKCRHFNTISTFVENIKQLYISGYDTKCTKKHCYVCKLHKTSK